LVGTIHIDIAVDDHCRRTITHTHKYDYYTHKYDNHSDHHPCGVKVAVKKKGGEERGDRERGKKCPNGQICRTKA